MRRPYGVWSRLLHATHRFPTAPDREWHELHHLERALRSPTNAGHTGSQYRLLGELTEYVRALASDAPLVVCSTRCSGPTAPSWDALEHLRHTSRYRSDHDLLTYRPDSAFEASPHRQMLDRVRDRATDHALPRLTRDEVKQWLEAAFHRQEVGREFLAFLYRHTEGNPLFISQLLRRSSRKARSGTTDCAGSGARSRSCDCRPGVVRSSRSDCARFSSSTQAVLATAAIIGREFDVGLLVGARRGSEPAVRLAISEAGTAGLLQSDVRAQTRRIRVRARRDRRGAGRDAFRAIR